MALSERDKTVLQRSAAAFTKKAPLDSFWQEVALNHYPERATFTETEFIGKDMTSGLYSAEPILFRREFGNFLGSTLRPSGKKWASISPLDPRLKELVKVKQYLEPKMEMMRALLYSRRSGYTRAMSAGDHDYGTFGNTVGTVQETADMQGLRFRDWHLKDCAWLQNDDRIVDTMFRKFRPTIRDICARGKKGWEVPKELEDIKEKEPDKEVNCLHVEMPVINYDYSLKRPKFEWVSLYYDVDHNHRLSYKLVPEFDYYVDRWFLLGDSQYAVSPCVICSMPDARALQMMTWSVLEAGEKAVEPPLVGVHEAILGGVSVAGGQVTWVDKNYDERTGEALRALELGGNPEFGEVLRQAITNNLNAAWFLNKLFMPQTNEKTAYEANRLHEEFLRAVLPIIEPAEAERNGNHLDIVLQKSMRMGLWGDMKEEMPKELRGRTVEFTYDNPMQDARKQEGTFAYKAAMEVNAIAKEFDPKAVAQFDHNTAYREAIMGVAPPTWLKDEDEAEELVEEAEEDETMDQAAMQMAAMAESQAKAQPKAPV